MATFHHLETACPHFSKQSFRLRLHSVNFHPRNKEKKKRSFMSVNKIGNLFATKINMFTKMSDVVTLKNYVSMFLRKKVNVSTFLQQKFPCVNAALQSEKID